MSNYAHKNCIYKKCIVFWKDYLRWLSTCLFIFIHIYKFMKHLTNEDFESTIANWVTLVDFFADRCGPCKILSKLMPRLELRYEDNNLVTIAKVDTESQKYLAGIHNIRSLPTVIIYKNGVEQQRIVWLLPPQAYADAIDSALAG